MDKRRQFLDLIDKEETITLATAAGENVTMRIVSPVLYRDAILIFTDAHSTKYQQLKANPHCCIAVGYFFAEANALFRGATMLEENAPLRAAYEKKFADAFMEGVAFGGRNADFILLKPTKLRGWTPIDSDSADAGAPFAIDLP